MAIARGAKDGWFLLASVLPLPFILFLGIRYYDTILYIGFGNLVLLNLLSLARKEKREADEKLRIERQSERLKLDLLKKNIQPHFIHNSLTSAIDWIERSPEKGVEFLFALSKEFDILLEVSDRQLIPLVKEIELCQAHLEIMTFRKEEPYTLKVKEIDEYALIPPAVLLTVVENGISYQRSEGSGIIFTLSSEVNRGLREYKLHVSGKSTIKEESTEGTGGKYIKARLSESYGNNWGFESHAVNDGWLTSIRVPEGTSPV